MKCNKCGKDLRIAPEKVGVDPQNNPIFHRFGYCDTCMLKFDLDTLEQQNKQYKQTNLNLPEPKEKKKHSKLSTAACVCSILGCTALIGFILALVDLCINDKQKKHIGSWFALVFCGLYLLLTFGLFSNNGDSTQETPPKVDISQSEENSNITYEIEYEQPLISDKEILFMEIPWGTSFAEVEEMHGNLELWGLSGENYKTYSVDDIMLGDYQGIDFEYDDINIIGNSFNGEIDVAGYTTREVTLFFAYDIVDGKLPKTEKDSSFYGAKYVFDTENLDGMSADLTDKITSLYGVPSKSTNDTDLYKNQYTYTWWYGQNDTVLVMKTMDTTNDTTDLFDNEITLSYVWLKGDELLQQASDLLKQEAIDTEKANYGNQNTSGL